ncbi:TPA: hypothetical protein QEL43_003182 [Stenotrophomonas maltophilia]|nr:hypothetical protein [Stenotrophomonas maltophilia]
MAKQAVTHERADQLIERLQAIQAAPPYQCWLGGDDTDQGVSYCRDCAQKEVDAGRAEFVDGGWSQDNDCPASCETCRAQLQYDLTEYGIEQELEGMMKYRLRAPVTPEAAYAIAQVLTNHREHSGVLALVPKVERLMADSQAVGK